MTRGLTVMVPSLAVPDGANDDEASGQERFTSFSACSIGFSAF